MLKGPVSIAANVTAKSTNLSYDISTGANATDIASDVTGLVQYIASTILLYAADKDEKLAFETKDWVIMPTSIPELQLPYIVKECSDHWLECFHRVTRYSVVLYSTHTGRFKCVLTDTKSDMMKEFNVRLQDIKRTLSDHPDGFKAIKEGKNMGYVMQPYKRTPTGTERSCRLANISNEGMIHFPHAIQLSNGGVLRQWLFKRKGKFLDSKIGSWKNMCKQLRIKHKAGTEHQSITSPISDFIGLWGCTTGTVANIHLASDGVISSEAKFIGSSASYISCCLCSNKPPNLSYRVGSKYDIVGAWC